MQDLSTTKKERTCMYDIINTCNMPQSNVAHLQYNKYPKCLSEVKDAHV